MGQHFDGSAPSWKLTPEDCTQCTYFCRSQLWAHLLYQDRFNELFQGPFWKANASGQLNKVTPFQLRQLVLESGFRLVNWQTQLATNTPPPQLLDHFSEGDLRTVVVLLAADVPA